MVWSCGHEMARTSRRCALVAIRLEGAAHQGPRVSSELLAVRRALGRGRSGRSGSGLWLPDGGKHRTHLVILGRAYLLLARRRIRRHANGEGRRTRAAATTSSWRRLRSGFSSTLLFMIQERRPKNLEPKNSSEARADSDRTTRGLPRGRGFACRGTGGERFAENTCGQQPPSCYSTCTLPRAKRRRPRAAPDSL